MAFAAGAGIAEVGPNVLMVAEVRRSDMVRGIRNRTAPETQILWPVFEQVPLWYSKIRNAP